MGEAAVATSWAGSRRIRDLWHPNIAPFGSVMWSLNAFVLPSSAVLVSRHQALNLALPLKFTPVSSLTILFKFSVRTVMYAWMAYLSDAMYRHRPNPWPCLASPDFLSIFYRSLCPRAYSGFCFMTSRPVLLGSFFSVR